MVAYVRQKISTYFHFSRGLFTEILSIRMAELLQARVGLSTVAQKGQTQIKQKTQIKKKENTNKRRKHIKKRKHKFKKKKK